MKEPKNKKVLVIGDSWAWCWYNDGPGHNNGGVFFTSSRTTWLQAKTGSIPDCFPIWHTLLKMHNYEPQIIAEPGSSNIAQIKEMGRVLDSSDQRPDIILLLQTDPLRDYLTGLLDQFDEDVTEGWEHRLIKKVGLHEWNAEYFDQVIDHTLLDMYKDLLTCVHSRGLSIPIMLMGGLSVVDTELLKNACDQVGYHNAHVVSKHYITDSIALMYDQVLEYPHPCSGNRISHLVDDTWDPSLITLLHDIHQAERSRKHPVVAHAMWPDHTHGNAGITVVAIEILNRYMDSLGL